MQVMEGITIQGVGKMLNGGLFGDCVFCRAIISSDRKYKQEGSDDEDDEDDENREDSEENDEETDLNDDEDYPDEDNDEPSV